MRKHILGITVFCFIVASFVLVYSYFNVPPIPVIPAVDYPGQSNFSVPDVPNTGVRGKLAIDYKVSAAEYDIASDVFRARIDLLWVGDGLPPKTLYLSLSLIPIRSERVKEVMKSAVIEQPFTDSRRTSVTVTINNFVDRSVPMTENIYTFVDFATDGVFPTKSEKRKADAELTPVLLIHDGARVRPEKLISEN